MVLVSVVWLIVNCAQKGFPALGKQCMLPPGCMPGPKDENGGDCDTCCYSCYGEFLVSGFTSMGKECQLGSRCSPDIGCNGPCIQGIFAVLPADFVIHVEPQVHFGHGQ